MGSMVRRARRKPYPIERLPVTEEGRAEANRWLALSRAWRLYLRDRMPALSDEEYLVLHQAAISREEGIAPEAYLAKTCAWERLREAGILDRSSGYPTFDLPPHRRAWVERLIAQGRYY